MSIANSGSVGRGKSFAKGEVLANTARGPVRLTQPPKVGSVAVPAKQAKVVPIVAAGSRNAVA